MSALLLVLLKGMLMLVLNIEGNFVFFLERIITFWRKHQKCPLDCPKRLERDQIPKREHPHSPQTYLSSFSMNSHQPINIHSIPISLTNLLPTMVNGSSESMNHINPIPYSSKETKEEQKATWNVMASRDQGVQSSLGLSPFAPLNSR